MMRVIFTTPNKPSLYSKAIQWWQDRPFSHVAIVLKIGGVDIVFQASYLTVHFYSWEKFQKENTIFYTKHLDSTRQQDQKLFAWAVQRLRTKYSIRNVLGIISYEIFKLKWFLDGDNGFTCSELIDKALEYLGIDLLEYTESEYVTPEDLYLAVRDYDALRIPENL